MSFYAGKRLAYDGNLCTVRYVGPLDGTDGSWLGVEWDDPYRGKHDGMYKSRRIFECRSTSSKVASFIRPTRTPDRVRAVLEAIKSKYEQESQQNGGLEGHGYQIIEISKKKVEEVGFDKIKHQMSQLENLKIVLVDHLRIVGLKTIKDTPDALRTAQNDLAVACPEISELDLGWNLIESWQEVTDICSCFPKLWLLKCNGLRLKSFGSARQIAHVTELQVNECLLRPDEVLDLLAIASGPTFPSLKSLSLSQNGLSSFEVSFQSRVIHSVKSLILDNNEFTTLADVAKLCQRFPNIDTLSLQGNAIVTTGTKTILSATLTTLNLSSNQICDFSFIDALPNLFPNLTSLRISRNPLHEKLAAAPPSTTSGPGISSRPGKPSDAPFYLTLARIPKLEMLNFTKITPRDREEGEIYYVLLVDKQIRSTVSIGPPNSHEELLATLMLTHPLYTQLCEKYDRPNLHKLSSTDPALLNAAQSANIDFAANASLASRLVTTTFHLARANKSPDSGDSKPETQPLVRTLPNSTPVYTLKSLIARHFSLRPLQFKLIYESEELDPEQVTTTKLWGSSREAWLEWGQWDVDLGPNVAVAAKAKQSDAVDADVIRKEVNKSETVDEGTWVDGGKVLLKGGTRWRKREVEIVDGLRGWGDYLDDGDRRNVRVRVEPWP